MSEVDHTPIAFLRAVWCNERLPLSTRMRAAIAALPFEHPKLAVTAQVDGRGFAAKLEAIRARNVKAGLFHAAAVLEAHTENPIDGAD